MLKLKALIDEMDRWTDWGRNMYNQSTSYSLETFPLPLIHQIKLRFTDLALLTVSSWLQGTFNYWRVVCVMSVLYFAGIQTHDLCIAGTILYLLHETISLPVWDINCNITDKVKFNSTNRSNVFDNANRHASFLKKTHGCKRHHPFRHWFENTNSFLQYLINSSRDLNRADKL